MKDLKEKALRGGLSKVSAQIINFALRIGSVMVLARLLEPKDFGLVAMATVVTSALSLFKDAGLSMATVQQATISHDQMSTLFWVNVLVGLILAAFLVNTAPVIADFYHEPRLVGVSMALAIDFLFTGGVAQHSALLQREMRFGTIALIDIIGQLASFVVAIAMASYGLKYWALVGQIVAMPCVSAICTWCVVSWIPSLPNPKTDVKSMIRFGGIVTLNWLIVDIARNLDKFLIGRFVGAEALGVYGRAYHLINIPSQNLNSAVSGVAFSTLSRLSDEPARQSRYFLKVYALLIALTLPITIACAVFADDMVFVLLGDNWQDTVPIFRLLAPTILVYGLISPFGWFLYATDRAARSMGTAFVIAPLMVVSYFIGLPYGAKGVAFAYSSAMAIWVIPHIAWCIHGTGISGRDILQTISRPFFAGIVAALMAIFIQGYVGQFLLPFFRLALGGSVMLACYLWILLYIMGQKAFYFDLFRVLKKKPLSKNSEIAAI